MKRSRSNDQDSRDTNRGEGKRTEGQPNIDYSSLQIYISDPKTIEILNNRGIKSLFKIQQTTFFDIHKGFDMLARDRTGSGKTLAYSLPIIQRFRKGKLFDKNGSTRMLVVLPTRQLAVQVANEIQSLKHHKGQYEVGLAFGGTSVSEQRAKLEYGADFVIATPGRLWHFLESNVIKCQDLSVICLDQADQMLKMGFKDDVDKILRHIKSKSNSVHQTLLFSATLPEWIMNLSKNYLKPDHKIINMIPDTENLCSTTIKHYKIQTSKRDRANVIKNLLNEFVPKNGLCIIFCQTKRQTTILQDELSKIMKQRIQTLSGDVTQQKRLRTFSSMKSGQVRFIVATNVAARGLDIPNVEVVIQCSPPKDVEFFIHRAGRTGRAGKQGLCFMLHQADQEYILCRIERQVKITFKNYICSNKSNNQKQQKQSVSFQTTYVEHHQNQKVQRQGLSRFKIQNWRKPSASPMQLSKYIQSIVDICDVTTKIDDNSKDRNTSIVFEVPQMHEGYILKLSNQFKTDGYKVEQLSQQRRRSERDY